MQLIHQIYFYWNIFTGVLTCLAKNPEFSQSSLRNTRSPTMAGPSRAWRQERISEKFAIYYEYWRLIPIALSEINSFPFFLWLP
jgi:hypothetical protein